MKITLERIQVIVAEHIYFDISKILPDTKLEKDLDLDSLDIIEIIMAIEEEFKIRIDESDNNGKPLITIADLVRLVEKTMGI